MAGVAGVAGVALVAEAGLVVVLAEERLGRHDWTVERYSIADIHLFRLYWRFATTLKIAPGAYPRLSAHYDRMMARPAVQRTLEAEAAAGYNWTQGPAAPRL